MILPPKPVQFLEIGILWNPLNFSKKKKLGKKYVIDVRIYNISGPGEKDPGKGVIEWKTWAN